MGFDLGKAAFGKESVSNLDKIQMIPLNQVHTNRENFYSIDGIEELAESIKMVGLLSPVSVVKCDNSFYKLISGHRRFEAYRTLREDAWFQGQSKTDYDTIPAIVLKNMDDLSETLALITANSTARELTYSEKLQQEQLLRETLLAMKEAGKDVPKNLGQYIADQIGVSRNEVSRMHSVNEKLIPEAREKVDAGEMTAQQAYEMSRKPEDEQSAALEKAFSDLDAITRRQHAEAFLDSFSWRIKNVVKCCKTRKDAISELKNSLRNCGNYGGTVSYNGYNAGLAISIDGTLPEHGKVVPYSDIYDALAYRAIAQMDVDAESDDVFPDEKTTQAWQAGTPSEPGEYACVVRWSPDMAPSKRVLYWDGLAWHFNHSSATRVDDAVKCLGWIPLPDDDPEEVE